jgi:6-phosphogluconate dehydrogenase
MLLKEREAGMRKIMAMAIGAGIPLSAMNTTLMYFDSFCSDRMPTNLIQAQRDYFGAHTYQRVDREGVFHTTWHEGKGDVGKTQ